MIVDEFMQAAEEYYETGDMELVRWCIVRAIRSYISEKYHVNISVVFIRQELDRRYDHD